MLNRFPMLFHCICFGAVYGALMGALYGNRFISLMTTTPGFFCGAAGGAVAGLGVGLTGDLRSGMIAGLIGGAVAGTLALGGDLFRGAPLYWLPLTFCVGIPSLVGAALGKALEIADRRRAYWVPGLGNLMGTLNAYRRSQRRL